MNLKSILHPALLAMILSAVAVGVAEAYVPPTTGTHLSPGDIRYQVADGGPDVHGWFGKDPSTCNPDSSGWCGTGACANQSLPQCVGFNDSRVVQNVLGVAVVDVAGVKYFDFNIQYEFPNLYCIWNGTPDRPSDFYFAQSMWLSSDPDGLVQLGGGAVIAWFEKGFWKPRIALSCAPLDYFYLTFQECLGVSTIVKRTIGPFKLPPRTQINGVCRFRDPHSCPNVGGRGGSWGGPGTGVFGPINVGSGDVSYSEPLFHVAGAPAAAPGLDLTLGYASSQEFAGMFGTSWSSTLTQTIEAVSGTSAKLLHRRTPASFDEYYTFSATTGKWQASFPAELRGAIATESGGTIYALADLDGTATRFDVSTGRWLSTTDRWGNAITANYGGLPASFSVADLQGRTLVFSLTGGLITQVQDSDGNTWRFSYSGGYLSQVQDPFHLSSGFWRKYDYATVAGLSPNPLSAVKDEQSKVIEGFSYDSLGRATTTFAEGNQNFGTLEYDTPGVGQTRVTTRIDDTPTNQISVFDLIYQGGRYLATRINGNCTSCSGADGDDQSFTYDAGNHVAVKKVGVAGQNEQVETDLTYDSNGMILTRKEAVGQPEQRTTTYAYGYVSPAGVAWPTFMTSVTEASAAKPGQNKVTTHLWNTSGSPETTLTTRVSGYLKPADSTATVYTTTSLFDPKHRQTEVDGPATNQKTTFSYFLDTDATVNRRGRPQQTSVFTSATAHLDTQFDDYDIFGTARTVIDPNGLDSSGNPIPNGARTIRTTDAKGRVRTVKSKQPAGDPNEPPDYTTTYDFDTRDRLTDVTLPRGNRLHYEYEEGTNRLLNTIRVDSFGKQQEQLHLTLNVIGGKTQEEAQICESPDTTCARWLTRRRDSFSYDSHNRLFSVVHPDANHIDYTYDSRGNLFSVKDERHTAASTDPNTLYAYDFLNRLKTVTQKQILTPGPDILTRYFYDTQDNLISVTDPNGNTTGYAYDDFRRLQTQTSPVSQVTLYSYDPAGNLTSSTDGNNIQTIRAYDALNRILSSDSGTGAGLEHVAWSYDDPTPGKYGKGRLATMTDPSGSTAYAYERRGLLRSESRMIQTDSYSLAYGYDANGNRSQITYPSGRAAYYTFDFADRPYSASSGPGGTGTIYVRTASYEPFGPETTLSFGNGTTKTMSYDSRYRPNENKLVKDSPLTTLADYVYTPDPLGNILGIADATNSGFSRTFGYDDLNRLTTANSGASLWGAGAYSYDAMGNMMSKTLGSSTTSFTYVGTTPKLDRVTESGVPRSVFYDAAGNETAVGAAPYVNSSRNYLSSGDGLSYTYDGRGLRTIVNTNVGGPAPTVASINPVSGTTAGGTPITIAGNNFQAGATVSLGGAAATGVTVTPPNSITATSGAHAAGQVNVVVTNPDSQSGTLANGFTYVGPAPAVSTINPTSGTTAGGTPVTITGTNFLAGATVSLGGVAATGITVTPPDTITATTGAHAAGQVNVVVTNPDSQSGTLTNGFTYVTPAPAPMPTSINPTSGSTAGGTSVTIAGTNFQTGATVSLGGVAATGVTVTPPNSITATTSAHAADLVNVVVTNPDSQSGTLTNGFTYVAAPPAPTVSSINPTTGTTAGGTPVTIGGNNFQSGATVSLGGVAATGVTVTPPNSITATSGAHAAGQVDVVVTNPDTQTGTLTNGFTYALAPTISSFSPTSGVTGIPVTINGTNFTGTTSVTFNGVPATTFTVNTAIKITATVPLTATTGKISVTAPGGTATSVGTFTVKANITGFSPASGAVGIPVTVSGSGFGGVTAVKFNGTTATFTPDSVTQITATVPANATTGKITVTTPGGTATSASDFVVAPRITSFTPTIGGVGATVTITGANLANATSVMFNGTSATIISDAATQIKATVPSGASTGPISVTTSAGTATSATNFTVSNMPTIGSFSPPSGGVGASVTINGTFFTGATSVKFNGTAASYTVNTDIKITATVPANATTGKITVTTPGGTATSTTDFTVAPRITSFSPTSGVIGSLVTINGANFAGTISVKFNGTSATFNIDSPIKITATVPAGATTGKISVTTPAGIATSTGNYTVKPDITNFTPTSGAVGIPVTINGTAFTGATSVKFNGTSAVINSNTGTVIQTHVPANATTGKITVTTPGGTATSANTFTVAPRITSFTPTSGAPPTNVTINGANFTGTTDVKFNNTPATFTVNSAVKITAPVPAGASTGKISVTTPAGTAISTADFTVTVAALGSPSSEVADAGPPASTVEEVNSESTLRSQSEMERGPTAVDQERLPVERVASLAFSFALGRDPGLTFGNVRLLGSGWPAPADSAAPADLKEDASLRTDDAPGGGAVTASLGAKPRAVATAGRRYSFYSPEMSLLAETEIKTDTGTPAVQYEYIWFNGHPVAQVDPGPTTHWTFTDHLGTPLIQTNDAGVPYWRAEHEPYGRVFALRTANQHQPLRLPGQESEELNVSTDGNGATERSYNIFRWYRSTWGRYTQSDPLTFDRYVRGLRSASAVLPANAFGYSNANPLYFIDRRGLFSQEQGLCVLGHAGRGALIYGIIGSVLGCATGLITVPVTGPGAIPLCLVGAEAGGAVFAGVGAAFGAAGGSLDCDRCRTAPPPPPPPIMCNYRGEDKSHSDLGWKYCVYVCEDGSILRLTAYVWQQCPKDPQPKGF